MAVSKKALITLAVIGLLIGAVGAAVAVNYLLTIPSEGVVEPKTELTPEPVSIDWGDVPLNTSITRLVNIYNIGTLNVTLNMTYTLASGSLTNYTLEWDCEGLELPVGYYTPANFTLTIYEASANPFHIDIHINGED